MYKNGFPNFSLFIFATYWYQLVKILQKYGDIENFELVYHRTGPLAGQSRGYAFVTYKMVKRFPFLFVRFV